MRFGLDENIIEKINSVFTAFPQVERAVIYGSRVKGNYKPASDIDITLMGKGFSKYTLAEIEFKIDDLLLPYKFDLSIYNDITNPEFKDHIDRIGVMFYEKAG